MALGHSLQKDKLKSRAVKLQFTDTRLNYTVEIRNLNFKFQTALIYHRQESLVVLVKFNSTDLVSYQAQTLEFFVYEIYNETIHKYCYYFVRRKIQIRKIRENNKLELFLEL